MHVKFIARGTGSAKAAVDYLLGERAAAGKLRDGVEVRRGDPDRGRVADTSGVVAWAPDAQIEAVLDKFERNGLGRARAGPLRPRRRLSTEPLTPNA